MRRHQVRGGGVNDPSLKGEMSQVAHTGNVLVSFVLPSSHQSLQSHHRYSITHTGVLIIPQPGLLPYIFYLKVRIFRLMLILLYIYIYIYIYGDTRGRGVQLNSFLTTTLDRSGQLHAPTALTLGNNPQYMEQEAGGGPNIRSGYFERRKILRLCWVSNHDRPASSPEHRLSYFTCLNLKT